MNNEKDSIHKPHHIQQKSINSFNPLKTLLIILMVAFISGTSGYLLGIRVNKNIPKTTQRIFSQPQPTITIQSVTPTLTQGPTQSIENPTWDTKIFRSEKLGFELKYSKPDEVMEETANGVSFGFSGMPYLKISTNQITNYKSLNSCKYGNGDEAYKQTLPCLDEGEHWGQERDIIKTKLGEIDAVSFYMAEGFPDRTYHIVQTNGSPQIEAKMFVSGGGLDPSFKRILSTFKILRNK